ncbi:non-ribosomal peptide synthetase [Phreatobacter sp. AB_2022a]|uniref:non-ribosomal peptide synthetase n=1 Tax=Phreatobacter sp. AB_2022a TaxID=3003134 RepID=UPI002286EE0A|nr:AMP-binding protein [Phreatobacter sp. AB_2022a]MCZ0737129.1 AMP-binding protein [Phreatobacter sp. AB_2022a]
MLDVNRGRTTGAVPMRAGFMQQALSLAGSAMPAPSVGEPPTVWSKPPLRALDAGGPVDHPFEALGASFADVPVMQHVRRIATRYPDKPAIADDVVELSYGQLVEAVAWLAGRMAAVTAQGEAVGLLLGNSAWFPVGLLAGLECDRLVVPLNPRDPPQRILDIIADAHLPVVVGIGAAGPPGWSAASDVRWIDVTEALAPGVLAPAAPHNTVGPGTMAAVGRPAIVLYTSGSTGRPKGIVNSERSLLQRVHQYVDACHIGPSDVLMPLSGAATIAGCREVLSALTTGATLAIVDVEAAGLRGVRRRFRSAGVTVVYIVPALLRALMRQGGDDFASLRIVRIAGERILWDDVAAVRAVVPAGCRVQVSYSSTETTGSQWFPGEAAPDDGVAVPAGYLLPGIEYAVLGEDGCGVAPGEAGELVICGDYVALGHWSDGEVVPLPTDGAHAGRRILPTGDLVTVAPDGLVRIVGRKGRQLKINGRRVEPAELEVALRQSQLVSDAAAIPTEAGELVAFVVPKPERADPTKALRDMARRTLPPSLHPARLHVLADLPRLAGGKLDMQALRDLDRDRRSAGEAIVAPLPLGTAAQGEQAVVARLWEAALRVPTASGRWDEAGGDSLKLLQCVLDIETALGRELHMDAFRVDMSFEEMVAAASIPADEPFAAAAADDGRPILFLFPGSVGYGPSMAAFGNEMGHVVRVVPIRYPSLEAILDGQQTVAAMTDMAFAQINAAQPRGDVRLLGYSLGGAVAFEAAARLLADGRQIRFLGILDTNVGGRRHRLGETTARAFQRIRAHRVTAYRLLCRTAAKAAVRLGGEARFARFLATALPGRLAATRFMLRLELEEILRMRAMGRWIGGACRAGALEPPLPIAGTLFRCERRGLTEDLGWRRLLRELEIVPIAGGHLDLVVAPHLAHNLPLILSALQFCRS